MKTCELGFKLQHVGGSETERQIDMVRIQFCCTGRVSYWLDHLT